MKKTKQFVVIPIDNREMFARCKELDIRHVYIVERVRSFEANGLPCYISNKQWAKEMNCFDSTVKRAIKALLKENILKADYEQKDVTNKKRILRINKTEVQNDTLDGSDCTSQGANLDSRSGQNEPSLNKLKKSKKTILNKDVKSDQRSKGRKIEELSDDEARTIIQGLKKGQKYMELTRQYGLELGSITKDFEKNWNKIKSERAYRAEQERMKEEWKNRPRINYDNIARANSEPKNEVEIDIEQMLKEEDVNLEAKISESSNGHSMLEILEQMVAERAVRADEW